MTRAATARFGLVLLVVVGLLTAAVAVGTRSPGPPGATLTVFTGRASITHAGTTRSAASGDVARDGDVVATAAGGRAALAYPDGSSTRLDVASTLTVHLDGTSVRVEQTAGLTWNRVRALAAGAGFRVDGPASSSAVVRGTLLGFYIEHDPAGLPVVWVDTWEGSVDVGGAGGATVRAASGQRVTVRAGSPPTAPAPIPATDSQLSFTVFNRALDAVPGRPVAFSEATLSAGREAPPLAVQVAGPADLNAVLAWPGSTYRLSVTGPSGTTTTEPDSSSPPVGFTFPSPPPGTWLFTVRDVASAAGEVSWLVVSRGP